MYKKILRMIPIYLLLIIIALMVVLPIIWVVLSGFKYEQDIISWPPSFFPRKLTNENWETIKSRIDIVKYIVNSVVYSVGTTVPAIFVNRLAGYAFSKLEFKGKNIIFIAFLATMMIPFQVIMVPLYVEVHYMKLLNTYAGLIIPKIASAQWIFLARASFDGIPKDLQEASRIDGCNEFDIFLKIMFPLIKPTCVTIFVLSINNCWNDLLWPMIVASSSRMRTLSNGLAMFIGTHTTEYGPAFLCAAISLVPMLIVYILGQRYFVEGQVYTGIKG